MNKNLRNGLIVLAVFVIIWFLPIPAGLNAAAWHLFAIFVATILGFILQPLPMGAIALLGIGLTGLFRIVKPVDIFSGFGNMNLWLIVSVFFFTKGFFKTGLGCRIAYKIMTVIGDSSLKMAYALVISDLLIAPATPSNTARGGGILYPIVRSLASAFGSEPGETSRKIGAYLMKTVFQGNCITSAMFLTAVASNTLVAALAMQTSRVRITWETWAAAGILPGVIALAVTPYIVYKLYPPEITKTPEAKVIARQELTAMGPMTSGEKVVAGTFALAFFLWSTATYTRIDAAIAAIVCVGILLVGKAIEWQDVLEEKDAWDTLLWLGALLSLTEALGKLGFITWFGKSVGASLVGYSWPISLGILLCGYMYTHYVFASLSAHVIALYAAFLAIAVAAGTPPFLAAMSLGSVSALYGGLTHYATGPAPIFFGSGYISQVAWWRIGFIMSVINLIIFIGIGSMWWKFLKLW